jgi:hypothetical protein
MANKVVVLPTQVVGVQNANLTAAGSFVAVGMGIGTVEIVTNLTVAPAGTITISVVEIDAGDLVTALGSTTTEAALSTSTTQKFAFTTLYSGAVKVSWTVTGGGAQGVYITATAEVSGGGGGGGGTVTQGSAAAISAPWPVELSNGTNAVGTSGAPIYVESVAGSTVALAAGSAAIGSVTVTGTPAVSATQGTAAAVTAPWPVELSNGTNAVGTSGAPIYVESVAGSTVALAAGSAAIGSVTVTGTPAVSATQGTAAAISAPWPVELSNGTNAVGTQAAPVYVEVTNGTQNLPTGDAQARAIQVTPGDGTHTTPAGDAVARPRYQAITDATNGPAAVKAASTAAVATDPGLVVTTSPNAPVFSQTASIATVSAVLKASAGSLKSVFAANRSSVALYLQFQNQTTAITNAGSAVLQFYVPPNGEIVIGSDFFVGAGWAFSTGIAWGFSTVTTTYTAYGTAANVDFQGMFL